MKSLVISAAAMAALVALGAQAQPGPAMDPKDFLQHAVADDTAEIQMGQMLQQVGGSPAVKRFGRVLVRDHTLGRRRAEAAARRIGAGDLPEQPDPEAVQQMSQLQAESGAAFDRDAKRIAVQDHQKAIAMFEQEASSGHGPAARHARATLPVLRKHLHLAEALRG